MNRIRNGIGILMTGCLALSADVVELQDGTRIEGTILAENEDSIEIEIGTNERGTIRRVLIIDGSEIRTWMADVAGRRSASPQKEVTRLGGKAYIDRLIDEAQKKINEGRYDEGIAQFGEAASLAGRDVEQLEPEDRVALMEKRAYAFRLQLAALKGKQHMLEEGSEGVEDTLEEMQDDLERDLRQFQSDKEDFIEEFNQNRHDRLGSSRVQTELNEREAVLERRQRQFVEIRQRTLQRIQQMEQDLVETNMQIELAEERVDQAEDEAKRADRLLR